MRIGIDCRTILNPDSGERAGVGHYTLNLVRALLEIDQDNEYVLFFDYRTNREAAQTFDQHNVRLRYFPFSSYGKFLPFAYSHMLVTATLYRDWVDVLHAPANVIPLTYTRPAVLTIHDLAIYRHPEWFPTQMFSTRLLVPQSIKKANRIIAVSEATKNDLRDLFNVPAKKITVIPEAADTKLLLLNDRKHDVRKIYKLPRRYVLFVGTLEARKNLPVLLQAWRRIQSKYPEITNDVKLVLAGAIGFGGETVLPLIKQLKLEKSVKHIGYVSHNHKILLIKQAQAFVFPSLYEGFGLPVLEAMQLCTPVIAGNNSSIPEVAGKAAVLIDPSNVTAMANAITRILTDPQVGKDLRCKGQAQALKFSWAKTAAATLKIYEQAVR